jgi:signal peptidase I
MNTRRWAGIIGSMLLVIPAYALAPAPLGSTTYATVSGTSMRPSLAPGDLVVVRASTYEVGDVVAYRDGTDAALVLHRIVATDGDRMTVKGDANDWVDSATPTPSDIVGELWFSIPGAGFLVTRGPMLLLLVTAFAVVLALHRARRRRDRPRPHDATNRPVRVEPSDRAGAVVTGSIALLFAVVGALTFALAPEAQERTYSHHGAITYAATTAPDAAYGDGRIRTGDPVFLTLVDRLSFAFTYEMQTEARSAMEGALSLSATIRDQGSRWARTLDLRPATRLVAPRQTTGAVLDLASLRALTQRFETITHQKPPHYDVAITASVDLVGTVDEIPHATSFSTSVAFTMNEQLLQPVAAADGTSAAYTATRAGSVRIDAGTIGGVPVEPVRAASAAGMLVFAALSLPYARRARRAVLRQPRRIARLIVEARTDTSPARTSAAVSITSMEDLAWIAHRGNRPILHEQRGDLDLFEVHDGEIVYRFEATQVHASA